MRAAMSDSRETENGWQLAAQGGNGEPGNRRDGDRTTHGRTTDYGPQTTDYSQAVGGSAKGIAHGAPRVRTAGGGGKTCP
jgi:hypothetical protein